MKEIFPEFLKKKVTETGIIAVLIIERLEDTRAIIEALLAGGVDTIELTLRTPAALDAIALIKKEYPQVICGAGTVLTPEQVVAVQAAGADFAVAPGLNRRVLDKALEIGLPFAPGITTASEIETALEYGCTLLKFFPAEASGGLNYLTSMNAPYKHLGLSYIPLGGLSQNNVSSYLKEPIIAGIGGSWLASTKLINAGAWETITENARAAKEACKKERA